MVDRIIIGAGLYGLYSAVHCGKKGESVVVLEADSHPFRRATYINQARVHQGYHYPRSLSTAIKSAHYFDRFNTDFGFCVNSSFEKIYAVSKNYSWTNSREFQDFCRAANIPCEPIIPEKYFKTGMVDGAFLTQEYTYDASILCEYLLDEISKLPNVTVLYNNPVVSIDLSSSNSAYIVKTINGDIFESSFVLNSTYAAVNQIIDQLGFEKFKIKYELCEIILCNPSEKLKPYGITVMDGPFFSIMPFGKTPYHSLTSVTFTPHQTSYDALPNFECQKNNNTRKCSGKMFANCRDCESKPETAYPYMSSLANKYLKDEYSYTYEKSLFSIKPILMASEIDDSRPTVIRVHSKRPTFVSVLSGKINTVYDLEEVLDEK